MTRLRGFAYATLFIAFAHLVFGGIVRISGSGMGCGDHWPKCYGRWFPPMDRTDLVIEISHRYLAAFLILSIAALVVAAFLRRAEPGVGGPGGVLRAATAALAVVVATALFGALTVIMGNPPHATVAHWLLAAGLFGLLAATVIRAGGLGGDLALGGNGSAKTVRSALVAVVIALLVIAMGGLTAKVPYAAVACPSFPLCGEAPVGTPSGVTHIQLTHRILAFLLFFHLLGIAIAVRRREESQALQRAAWAAFAATLIQLLVAGAMIGMRLPPVPRALHQTMGVLVWITTVVLWYLARRTAGADAASAIRTAERMPLHARERARAGA